MTSAPDPLEIAANLPAHLRYAFEGEQLGLALTYAPRREARELELLGLVTIETKRTAKIVRVRRTDLGDAVAEHLRGGR